MPLYAAGLTLAAVAHRIDISPHNAKEYLDRVRRKYELMGRAVRTRTELDLVLTDTRFYRASSRVHGESPHLRTNLIDFGGACVRTLIVGGRGGLADTFRLRAVIRS